MIKRLYAVYDAVALEMMGPLMVLPNDAAARRVFQDAVTNEQSSLFMHPHDYVLCHLGEIDTQTGTVTPVTGSTMPHGFGVPVVTGEFIVDAIKRRKDAPSGLTRVDIPQASWDQAATG